MVRWSKKEAPFGSVTEKADSLNDGPEARARGKYHGLVTYCKRRPLPMNFRSFPSYHETKDSRRSEKDAEAGLRG